MWIIVIILFTCIDNFVSSYKYMKNRAKCIYLRNKQGRDLQTDSNTEKNRNQIKC